jgi:hypothetical protein
VEGERPVCRRENAQVEKVNIEVSFQSISKSALEDGSSEASCALCASSVPEGLIQCSKTPEFLLISCIGNDLNSQSHAWVS